MNVLKHIKRFYRNNQQFFAFVGSITLIYGLTFIFSEFYDLPCNDATELLHLSMQWALVCLACYALIYVLSISEYIFSITFPLLSVLCAAMTYFRVSMKITFTPQLLDLILINDVQTGMDVLSWPLACVVIFSLITSIGIVIYRCKKVRVTHHAVHCILALSLLWITAESHNHTLVVKQRMPLCFYYSTLAHFQNKELIAQQRPEFTGKPYSHANEMNVIFILGESVRAKNLHINGYERNTTPLLCKEKNVVSFPHVHNDYCFTHTSVPHLLTRSDSAHAHRAYSEPSFIQLFHKAGFRTAWIANQEAVQSFIYFTQECDTAIFMNSGKTLYVYDEWLDTDLIQPLQNELKNNASKRLIVLHTIGSHWWYKSHYTPQYALFKPELSSRRISADNHAQMINSYDNSILYSDYVWHSIFNQMRNTCSVVIYMSDHGECLGEEGYYTHGTDRPELHNPAFFIWWSEKYAASYPNKVKALRSNKDKALNAHILFHTMLDAGDIHTSYKEKEKSVMVECPL